MPLATIENVTATVGNVEHNISLTIEEDGLVVGSFGKLPWAGATVGAEVVGDGCVVDLDTAPGIDTHYFIPAESFASFGGIRVMKTFTQFLMRSAVAAGAHVIKPAA